MNPNYTEFKFPQIKAHPWTKVNNTNIQVDNQMFQKNKGLTSDYSVEHIVSPSIRGEHMHLSVTTGVQTPYSSRSHHPVLPPAGVHTSLPILPIWSLLTCFLWWAASTKHAAAQWPRAASTLQLQPHRFRDVSFWAVLRPQKSWNYNADPLPVCFAFFFVNRAVDSAPTEFNPHSSSRSHLHHCFPWWDKALNTSNILL